MKKSIFMDYMGSNLIKIKIDVEPGEAAFHDYVPRHRPYISYF
jgi:hypothetical protein